MRAAVWTSVLVVIGCLGCHGPTVAADGDPVPWPVPGAWSQPFLDRGCTLRVASDPNAAISNWSYRACDSGPAGCELAEQDWTDLPGIRLPNHSITVAEGKPILEYARIYRTPQTTTDIAYVDVVQELDGPRLAVAGDVVAEGARCLALALPTSRGLAWWASRSGKGIDSPGYAGARSTPAKGVRRQIDPTMFAGTSTWATPTTVTGLHSYATSDFGSSASSVQSIYASAHSLFLVTAGPTNVATTSLLGGGALNLPKTPTAAEALVEVPGGMIGVSTDTYGIRHIGYDAASNLIYQSPGIEITNAVAYDQTTHWVVWRNVVVANDSFTEGKIYAAPYVQGGKLVPKLVTKVPPDFDYFIPSVVANAGYVVLVRTGGRARVVRISDGMGWDFALPSNKVIVDILWVDDDRVWFWIGKTKQPTGILRQARAGWGPPTVAPIPPSAAP